MLIYHSFSMYRLRTADKGKPLIISDAVLQEYSDCNVDTLHKKNLLSLGEDRYLTTLMTKHFPYMSYKFIPDAYASTAAPETWGVLLSQRRRWINSTIHNLAELVWLQEMCGFCCFSMRFVVFIDLFGTIILPATCAYLGYLIYRLATHSGQFPLISVIMIGAVYGLQALVFVLKRQWQHIGWMIIYLVSFPVYAFALPVYSFWNQDNFTWGNTRIVIGEKGSKKVLAVEDDGFDPRSIPLQRWDDYALANNLPGRRGVTTEKEYKDYDDTYEMDDMKSMYSSVKPASTILTGLPNRSTFMPPQSPAPFTAQKRQSMYSVAPYSDNPAARNSMMSLGGGGGGIVDRSPSPYQDTPPHHTRTSFHPLPSTEKLLSPSPFQPSPAFSPSPSMPAFSPVPGNRTSTIGFTGGNRSPDMATRPVSQIDFSRGPVAGGAGGPDDATIMEAIRESLREVDLDTVTKKQVRGLVERRLGMEIVGERRRVLDAGIDVVLARM